jgi:hypothetical protein
MLWNDQIETLPDRLFRGEAEHGHRSAIPSRDITRSVCIDDSIGNLIENCLRQYSSFSMGPSGERYRQALIGRSVVNSRGAPKFMVAALEPLNTSEATLKRRIQEDRSIFLIVTRNVFRLC